MPLQLIATREIMRKENDAYSIWEDIFQTGRKAFYKRPAQIRLILSQGSYEKDDDSTQLPPALYRCKSQKTHAMTLDAVQKGLGLYAVWMGVFQCIVVDVS